MGNIICIGRNMFERSTSAMLCLTLLAMLLVACDIRSTSAAAIATDAKPPSSSDQWGTSARPFSPDSLWNSRPLSPVFSNFVIPASKYMPAILDNGWSTGVFISKETDHPVTVHGLPGSKGLWNADDHAFHDVTIPRWPSDVRPASESDGHADIVDPMQGVIHSFWQLKNRSGQWVAAQYTWTSLRGSGWGDPAHYFQGSRATGVPAMAGLIRKHEVNDGMPMYRHALAMSLTFNALSPNPAYIFPATSADKGAFHNNYGKIPQGALLMLPASFDTSRLSDNRMRKIAETLKNYGAYVVDRNDGTPFVIYAEIGSGLNLHGKLWNKDAAGDLESIRLSLRQVVSSDGWVDGQGRRFEPNKNLNLISMRGPWQLLEGEKLGVFDSWSQSVHFPKSQIRTVQAYYLPTSITNVNWAAPKAGNQYRFAASTTGGARLQLKITDKATGREIVNSGELKDGETFRLIWPSKEIRIALYAIGGVGEPSSARAHLKREDVSEKLSTNRMSGAFHENCASEYS